MSTNIHHKACAKQYVKQYTHDVKQYTTPTTSYLESLLCATQYTLYVFTDVFSQKAPLAKRLPLWKSAELYYKDCISKDCITISVSETQCNFSVFNHSAGSRKVKSKACKYLWQDFADIPHMELPLVDWAHTARIFPIRSSPA